MITGIDLNRTKDYISPLDEGDPKTIWKLGALDSEIYDLIGEDKNPLKVMSEAVRFGLKGLENFNDSYGNAVKFKTISRAVGRYNYKVVADEIMKIIPPEIKTELGSEILKLSRLSEQEAKNS